MIWLRPMTELGNHLSRNTCRIITTPNVETIPVYSQQTTSDYDSPSQARDLGFMHLRMLDQIVGPAPRAPVTMTHFRSRPPDELLRNFARRT